jgi:hypothetical protein
LFATPQWAIGSFYVLLPLLQNLITNLRPDRMFRSGIWIELSRNNRARGSDFVTILGIFVIYRV